MTAACHGPRRRSTADRHAAVPDAGDRGAGLVALRHGAAHHLDHPAADAGSDVGDPGRDRLGDDVQHPGDRDRDAADEIDVSDREVRMAESLVESLSATFEPEKYRDEYREQVLDLIQIKASGEEFTMPEAVAEKPKVVDLMAALEASVRAAKDARVATPRPTPNRLPRQPRHRQPSPPRSARRRRSRPSRPRSARPRSRRRPSRRRR